ncbi:MAG: sigma-70 family RNA polymerase sigma factor [Firmicutes bacterium]|nr:sigma-70 family RNA polymerase sigma factor [Bacillota bacterium]
MHDKMPSLSTAPQDKRSQQLEYLMRRFGDQVLKLAYYYVQDQQLAEDISQEVFFRVYTNLDRFRQESSYFTWIYRITVNLCRDHLRSAAFRRLIPWGDTHALEKLESEPDQLPELTDGGEVWRQVMNLPVNYRVVLALFYFHDLPVKEIARITNMKEGTVRVNLSRARKRLKDNLVQQGVQKNAGQKAECKTKTSTSRS